MKGLFIRWLVLTCAITVTAYIVAGIHVSGFLAALTAAVFLSILNSLFRPILLILTLPINILTLGLFTFVINAILLKMVSGVVTGFDVHGFWSAVFGSILISLVSWLLTSFISDKGSFQYIYVRKDGQEWRWRK